VLQMEIPAAGSLTRCRENGCRHSLRDGRWPDLKSTFLLRDAFFPVCSPALLEGMHPLRGPEDLKHHTLIHDRSMASESAFPTWRTWLQAASFPEI
jgi:LysR family transcriptional regulator, glycine cleavage system transcriptional activator